MEVKDKKVLVWNDEATYNSYRLKEQKILQVVDDLIVLSNTSLGLNKVDSWIEYLKNPSEYLVQRYWQEYGLQFNPPHTDREKLFFNSVAIGPERLIELKASFDKLVLSMGKYAPTVTKKGLTSKLKKEMFNKWLNPEKANEYFACLELIEASKKMLPYNANAHMLIRFYDGVRLNDVSELIPDFYRFV